jgi:hypothetical protein
MRTVIIQNKESWGSEYKKYRSTEEHIRQNQQENRIQRERDERARSERSTNQNSPVRRENAA